MNSKLMSVPSGKDLLQHAQSFKMADDEADTEIDQVTFRQGMSNLGAAVNVITTDGAAGQAGDGRIVIFLFSQIWLKVLFLNSTPLSGVLSQFFESSRRNRFSKS